MMRWRYLLCRTALASLCLLPPPATTAPPVNISPASATTPVNISPASATPPVNIFHPPATPPLVPRFTASGCLSVPSCHCESPASLTCLVSSDHELRDVAAQLKYLPQLQLADITVRGLKQLPGQLFSAAAQLRGLMLTGSQARDLPKDLLDGLEGSLVTLGLGQNRLKQLPTDVLGKMRRLERLDMSGNQLASLQDRAFQSLANLQQLNLADNQISELSPTAFIPLPKLKLLNLDGNPLSSAHISGGSLLSLTSLRQLTLDRCQLTALTPRLTSALPAGLTMLTLSYNRITSIDHGALAPVPGLTALDLSFNQIEQIPDGCFSHLAKLETLKLNGNSIITLSRLSFTGLGNIQMLDLSDNSLQSLPAEALLPIISLRHLMLARNDLISLAEAVLVALPQLKYLDVTGNPLHCDCSLAGLASRLNGSTGRLPLDDRTSAVCTTPPNLENAPLAELSAADLSCADTPPTPSPTGSAAGEPKQPAQLISALLSPNLTGVHLVWHVDTSLSPYRCDKVTVLDAVLSSEEEEEEERSPDGGRAEFPIRTNFRVSAAASQDPTSLELDVRWPENAGDITGLHRFCVHLSSTNSSQNTRNSSQICSDAVSPLPTQSLVIPVNITASVTDSGVTAHVRGITLASREPSCAVAVAVFGSRGPLAAAEVSCSRHQVALDAAVGSDPVRVCTSAPYQPEMPLAAERTLDPGRTASSVVFVHCVVAQRENSSAILWATGGAVGVVVLAALLLTVFLLWRRLYKRAGHGRSGRPRWRGDRGFARTLTAQASESQEILCDSGWNDSDPET